MAHVGKLGDPPAQWDVEPRVLSVPAGTVFVRLHDPVSSPTNPYPVIDPSGQRTAGPFHRFDHHIPSDQQTRPRVETRG